MQLWSQDYTFPAELCLPNGTTCGKGDVPLYAVNMTTAKHIQVKRTSNMLVITPCLPSYCRQAFNFLRSMTCTSSSNPLCYTSGLSIRLLYADLFGLYLFLYLNPFIRCWLLSLYHYIVISVIIVRYDLTQVSLYDTICYKYGCPWEMHIDLCLALLTLTSMSRSI